MAALGLTAEDGVAKVWFVSAAGDLVGGAAAVNAVMRRIWWARPLALFYRLPGFKQLEDWLYQWVADHRYLLPGRSAACELPAPDPEKRTKSS